MTVLTQATFCLRDPDRDHVLGTGVLVSPRLIVTCAHVVGQRERVRALSYDRSLSLLATVKERGSSEIDDVAVLELEKAVVNWEPLRFVEPDSGDTFVAVGYPEPLSSEVPDDQEDFVHGTLSGPRGTGWPGRWQLRIRNSEPARPGLSGGALWVPSKDAAVGLVVARDPDRPEAFYCIPRSLFADRVKRLQGGKPFEECRRRVTADIVYRLKHDAVAAKALASQDDGWLAEWRENAEAGLAEAFWATRLIAVIEAMCLAQVQLIEGRPELMAKFSEPVEASRAHQAALTIEEILENVVPRRVVEQVVYRVEEAHGGVILRIPVATESMAELTAAGHYDRAWSFEAADDPKRAPLPSARVGPRPESLLALNSPDGEGPFLMLLQTLAGLAEKAPPRSKAFLYADDQEELFGADGVPRHGKMQEILDLLNGELRRQVKAKGLRHYVLYPKRFVDQQPTFLRLVSERLHELHVVVMEGGDRVEERQLFRWIHGMLDKSPRRKK